MRLQPFSLAKKTVPSPRSKEDFSLERDVTIVRGKFGFGFEREIFIPRIKRRWEEKKIRKKNKKIKIRTLTNDSPGLSIIRRVQDHV